MRLTKLQKALIEHGYVDRWREEWRQEGWQEGEQEGWQKGLIEGKKSDARAMLAAGMGLDTISQITGFTADEIQRL
jgi:predicted transposase/invertase (TIGR01784 family)